MRVTAIRVSDDLWGLLETEATRLGVSVSQYVREAALARASAAAGVRAEDPFDLLAYAAEGIPPPPPEDSNTRAGKRALKARTAARDARSDARATRAESEQARLQALKKRASGR